MRKILLTLIVSIFLLSGASAIYINEPHGIAMISDANQGTSLPTGNIFDTRLNTTMGVISQLTRATLSDADNAMIIVNSTRQVVCYTNVSNGDIFTFTNCIVNNNTRYIAAINKSGGFNGKASGGGQVAINRTWINWTGTSISENVEYAGQYRGVAAINISELYFVPSSLTATLSLPQDQATINAAGFNFTANYTSTGDTRYNFTNVTYYIWNSTGLFNQTNVTIKGNSTNSSVLDIDSFILGTYKWNVLLCGINATGSLCLFAPANYTFTIGFANLNSTYNSTTYPTSVEGFKLTFTSQNVLSSAFLVYNGTPYSATIASNGQNYNVTRAITIPTYPVYPSNVSLFWRLLFTNVEINTSLNYQNVINLTGLSVNNNVCANGLNSSFFFNFADEQNLTAANASVEYNFQYGFGGNTTGYYLYGNLSNVASFRICLNQSQPFFTIGYGEIDYTISGDVSRKFYLFPNTRASNVTYNATLYGLLSGVATAFEGLVEDTELNLFKGYYTTLLRWYPSLNEYRIVEMGKTDDNGNYIFDVQQSSVDYRIGVYDTGGNLVQLFPAKRFICQTAPCVYTIFVTNNAPDYTSFYGVETSLTYNSTTHLVTLTWSDPSQATNSMNLTLIKTSSIPDVVICSEEGQGFTGVLQCDITGETGTFNAIAFRSASPNSFINSLFITTKTGLNEIANGGSVGLFLMFTLAALGALIGVFSPIAALALGLFSLIPAYMLGVINYMVLVGFFIIGGIVFHFTRKT